MKAARTMMTVIAALTLVAAACGDDAGEATTTTAPAGIDAPAPADTSPDTDDTTPDAPPPAGAPVGSAVVDGTPYAFQEVLLCDEDEMLVELGIEQGLELVASGRSDAGFVQLDLYIETFAGTELHDVSWNGPEGLFANGAILVGGSWVDDEDRPVAGPPITIGAGRATGSMVLYDVFGDGGPIEVVFDVQVPTELTECR